jgi:hypothetical protein
MKERKEDEAIEICTLRYKMKQHAVNRLISPCDRLKIAPKTL